MDKKFLILNCPKYEVRESEQGVSFIHQIGPLFLFAELENTYIQKNQEEIVVSLKKIILNETDLKFTENNEIIKSDQSTRKEWTAAYVGSNSIEIFDMDNEESAYDYFLLKKALAL